MTPRQWRNHVANLLDALLTVDLAVHTRPVVALETGKGWVRVTWPTPATGMQGKPFLADFYSVETYFGWLRTEQFSAVLFDGSLLQLTFDIEGSELVGHRLGYIPVHSPLMRKAKHSCAPSRSLM